MTKKKIRTFTSDKKAWAKEWRASQLAKDPNYRKTQNDRQTDYRVQYKRQWIRTLTESDYHICRHCGYDKNFDVIDFYHINSKDKLHSVRFLITKKPTSERLNYVFLNTIPLCANCYRVQTIKNKVY